MKKLTLALVVCGAFAASAQAADSSVVIYGLIDLGIAKTSGAATTASPNLDAVQQRANHASRLGFRGNEDLGNGLSALFQLETEFLADTGAARDPFWTRIATVGVAGGFGTVKFGRIKGVVDGAVGRVDPFNNDGVIGDNTTLVMRGKVSQSRLSNAITYNSNTMAGFGINAQYILSEVKTLDAGYEFLVTYDNGPISAHIGYERPVQVAVVAPAALLEPAMVVVGGGYKFGPAKITAAYTVGDPKTPATGKYKGILVGLNYTIGAGDAKLVLAKQKTDVKDVVKEIGIGYDYHMSKRTDVYAYLGREQVVGATAVQFGVSHKF
ncbi:MAG: porin [Pseudomonadota bacterium]